MKKIMKKSLGLLGLIGLFGLIVASFAAEPSSQTELYTAAGAQQRKPPLVMVGTIDAEGFPQTRVMSNLRFADHAASKLFDKNDFTTYAMTRADTEKLQHLAGNPNMSMYYQSGAEGLLLMGKGEIVTDSAVRRAAWDDAFKQMGYADADDPMLVLLKFTPSHGKFYYKGKQNKLTFPTKEEKTANKTPTINVRSIYNDIHEGKSKPAFDAPLTVTGYVVETGISIYATPYVSLSDEKDGKVYATCVLPRADVLKLKTFQKGKIATLKGNYYDFHDKVIIKKCVEG